MDIYTYFFPNETIAQVIVVSQFLFLVYWFISYFIQSRRLKKISSQINDCDQVGELAYLLHQRYLPNIETSLEEMTMVSPKEAIAKFDEFCTGKKISENSPLYKHLRAIFFAGFNESQLNVESLIKTTSSRIIARNTALRSYISLFIVLGLLGTLFGLASSLSELSSILSNTDQLNDEILKTGLNTLLAKLAGAFSPSIWGVLFTVIGVLAFARYIGKYSFPTLQLLEHQTLTNWVPNLIPTASQRLLDKLYLSEKQMEKNFAAAEKVAKFAEQVSGETSELGVNIKNNNDSLKKLSKSAEILGEFTTNFTQNLNEFAQNFRESVERLSPVTEGLSELYQKILSDSKEFQESVKETLDNSQTFRTQVQEEFDRQSKQSQTLLESLKFYETAYLENRQSTDEKIQSTLSAAEQAFDNLSQQNDVFIEALKTELAGISESLGQITAKSDETLGELSANISGEIHSVAVKLGQLENPLQNSADSIEATASTFESRTQNFLKEIRQEFQNQNDHQNNENTNILNLNNNIQNLSREINNLNGKMKNFSQGSGGYSTSVQYRKNKNALVNNPSNSINPTKKGYIKRMIEKLPFRRK